ncbi:MAG: neutral zinc metallopeptidase [Anderseniella sp.]|nr:neutral zinc metallopeptidase [Anderseniella sp.]
MGRRGGGGIGIGTIIILGILGLVFGGNPLEMLGGGGLQQQTQQIPQTQQQQSPAANDEMGKFASKVLSTTERTWTRIFKENGREYEEPRMVLFSGYVQSACGAAQSAMGPFYCPRDKKIYIDLSFFRDMSTRLGASGDFAHAYVIAHEVGHHVQTLLGIAEKVTAARLRSSKTEANRLSVRMELQADCLAGVWARDNKNILEQGDIEEGLNAATAIGDDRLQKRSQGYVVPESFTHGTSAQRVEWFKRGIQTGNISQCDTFG